MRVLRIFNPARFALSAVNGFCSVVILENRPIAPLDCQNHPTAPLDCQIQRCTCNFAQFGLDLAILILGTFQASNAVIFSSLRRTASTSRRLNRHCEPNFCCWEFLPVAQGNLRPVYKPHSVQQWSVLHAWAIISLGGMSPCRSMQPTRDWLPPDGSSTCGDEQPPIVRRRLRPCLALLPAGVTWPHALLRAPVVFYTTFSPLPAHPLLSQIEERRGERRSVSVALSGRFTLLSGFPAPGTLRRRALWSADFPRPRQRRAAIARPT